MAASSTLIRNTQIPGGIVIGSTVIALLLTLLLVAPNINSQHQAALVAAESRSLQQQFNLTTAALETQLATIAASTHLSNIVSNNDFPARATEETLLLKQIPGAVRVRIFALREAEVERDAVPPFSFTSLDLVNRSEIGERVHPEAIKNGPSWILSVATPIKAGNGNIIGTLFVYLEMTALVKGLNIDGDFALIQQIGTASPSEVFATNTVTEGMDLPLNHPNWQLRFAPSTSGAAASVTSFVLLLLPLILVLLAALGALYLAINRLLRSVDRDLSHFEHQVSSVYSGNFVPSTKYHLDGFSGVDASLARLARSPSETISPIVDAVAVKQVAKDDSQPDSDIVDIEIMDDESFEEALGKLEDGDGTDAEPEAAPEEATTDFSSIFRAYDIRGVVNEDLSAELIHDIGLAIGSEAIEAGEQTVAVAADGRISSPEVMDALIAGLRASGRDVVSIGQVPTPVLYYATHNSETESGVMVTGSHNPPEYNGFKIVIAGRTLVDEDIKALYQRIQDRNFTSGEGSLREIDLRDEYLDAIIDDVVVAQPLRIVVDCGNGIAGDLAPELFTTLGCDVIPLYCDVDGNFPNHPPDPTVAANLQALVDTVRSEQADLGIALDGDGDRVVAVSGDGSIVLPDRLMMLFVKDVISRNPGSDVVYDIKCSRYLNSVISNFGGRPVLSRSGHSFMKAKMAETGAVLAGEMSGHVCFAERWFGFDDGLYAAARLLEIVGSQTEPLGTLLAEFPEGVSTPELFIAIDEQRKFTVVDALVERCQFDDATTTTLDGLRIDFADGWGLIRASNTNPALTLRFEADSDAALERIQDVFREQLQAVDSSLDF